MGYYLIESKTGHYIRNRAHAILTDQEHITNIPSYSIYIKLSQSGNENSGYWDLPGNKSKYKKGDNLALYKKDFGEDQQFYIGYTKEKDVYTIRSKNGDGYVDVAGGKNGNGINRK